ncbi:inositol monophosphatase 3-like isoform X2 [Penaeus chinensis]|nr:inositol monophosphatase 3-like isoform X2 [Penaeus chinensis]XP_047486591.1 inositol monophosphatase 3-like isoform X2 [Penaeus chinensis]
MNLGASVRINKLGVGIIGGVLLMIVLVYRNSSSSEGAEMPFEMAQTGARVSLKKLLAAAIDAADRGGKIVYQIREEATLHEQSKGKTKEGANDPVTDGDIKSHMAMFYSIKNAFPGVEVISEEHSSSDINQQAVAPAATSNEEVNSVIADDLTVPIEDVRVWIDPLDATQEYTENLRQYVTTMVCVAVKGIATIGVINKPFSNFIAWGWAGHGVSPKMHISKTGPKDDIVHIIVSRSHTGNVEMVAKAAWYDRTNITKAGGAGFKTLAVIQGDADAYIHSTAIKKWDLCAGNAILNALQGKMTTLDGTSIDYSSREMYKNEGGLLATLYNHNMYLEVLKAAKSQ